MGLFLIRFKPYILFILFVLATNNAYSVLPKSCNLLFVKDEVPTIPSIRMEVEHFENFHPYGKYNPSVKYKKVSESPNKAKEAFLSEPFPTKIVIRNKNTKSEYFYEASGEVVGKFSANSNAWVMPAVLRRAFHGQTVRVVEVWSFQIKEKSFLWRHELPFDVKNVSVRSKSLKGKEVLEIKYWTQEGTYLIEHTFIYELHTGHLLQDYSLPVESFD